MEQQTDLDSVQITDAQVTDVRATDAQAIEQPFVNVTVFKNHILAIAHHTQLTVSLAAPTTIPVIVNLALAKHVKHVLEPRVKPVILNMLDLFNQLQTRFQL